jgi:hypothetical protein
VWCRAPDTEHVLCALQDVERGADEHWDVEDVGEQDDEEEVHVNADDEREARERGVSCASFIIEVGVFADYNNLFPAGHLVRRISHGQRQRRFAST